MGPSTVDAAVPPHNPRAGAPRPTRGPFGQFAASAGRFVFEVGKVVLVALAIIVPVRMFLVQPFAVSGSSMDPTFLNRDYLVIDEISYRLRSPERGEVIVFRFPRDRSQFFIKRLIGLPGETIRVKDGGVFIINNGREQKLDESSYLPTGTVTGGANQEVVLASDEYFVLGDNRGASSDSRAWGPVKRSDMVGRAWVRAYPFDRATAISTPAYDLLSPAKAP